MNALLKYIGLRHLAGKRTRTVLTVSGIAFGIALYIGITLINRATLQSFEENFSALSGQSQITVSSGDAGFPEDKLAILEEISGVRSAVPMVEDRAYLTQGQASETLTVLGVDLLREGSVRGHKTADGQVIDDPLVFFNQPDSIIVSETFAKSHGFKIDSKIELMTAHGVKGFTVRGILAPEGAAKAYGGAIAIMDIDGERASFSKEGRLDRVDLVLRQSANPDEVVERCKKALGPGYTVEKPENQAENLARMVKSFQVLLSFASMLAILVGLFMVANSVSMSVTERKREIGILRALGATRWGILAMFLGESCAIGAIGSFLGSWLGWFAAVKMVNSVAGAISAQYMTAVTPPTIVFGPNDVIQAIAIGTLAAAAAALWPAFGATRIQPIEAIRKEDAAGAGIVALPVKTFVVGMAMLIFLCVSSILEWPDRIPALEGLDQAFSVIGTILAVPALACLVARFFRLGTGSQPIARLSQDNLIRDPRRMGNNVLSLLTGLLLVIVTASVNASFRMSIEEWADRVLQADIAISGPGPLQILQSQPLDESLADKLNALPAIRDVSDKPVYAFRFVHLQYEGKKLGMKTFDRLDASETHTPFDFIEGDPTTARRELYSGDPVVFVSRNFVERFKRGMGEEIEIDTPSGPLHAKIAAVINDYSSNEGVLYMDRALYKKMWKDPLVSAFYVRLKKGVDVEAVRKQIDTAYGKENHLTIRLNSELKADILKNIDQSFSYSRAIEGSALLIALLGLINTLLISILERTRELGLLRAVGMSGKQLSRMIMIESFSQGVIASLFAIGFGWIIAFLWVRYSLTRILGWSIHFHFPITTVCWAVGLGLTVSLLAGILPSRHAARLEIKDALAYE